mmetsp:Transcript_16024/g.50645  ORF Transcript_16024/g.50645 Transcript_16024/m.50645 type:complete len:343 (-) Transcript_16024:100-1128(-)
MQPPGEERYPRWYVRKASCGDCAAAMASSGNIRLNPVEQTAGEALAEQFEAQLAQLKRSVDDRQRKARELEEALARDKEGLEARIKRGEESTELLRRELEGQAKITQDIEARERFLARLNEQPAWFNYVAAFGASCVSTSIMHPLDTLRTREIAAAAAAAAASSGGSSDGAASKDRTQKERGSRSGPIDASFSPRPMLTHAARWLRGGACIAQLKKRPSANAPTASPMLEPPSMNTRPHPPSIRALRSGTGLRAGGGGGERSGGGGGGGVGGGGERSGGGGGDGDGGGELTAGGGGGEGFCAAAATRGGLDCSSGTGAAGNAAPTTTLCARPCLVTTGRSSR